ncbi:hypothetical protein BD414DRAFT_471585 [Trametes punicea]|nr:hypothetical protein BD414DRAFT_471585 [Trametes punicea]
MAVDRDPNFPSDLDIRPLASASSDSDARFDAAAQEGAIKTYGIAGRIWEASHAMLAYLDPASPLDFDPHPPAPKRDLLIVTDLPEVCTLLEANLRAYSAIWIRPLAWGSTAHVRLISEELGLTKPAASPRYPTHILCSDLIYFPALLAPLLRTLIYLTSPPFVTVDDTFPRPAVVILSYKIRSLAKETPFWSAFGLWFEFTPVLAKSRTCSQEGGSDSAEKASWSRFSLSDGSDGTFVLIAQRRPESLQWTVPGDDAALLSGVGARSSDSPKSDDQFEELLLMGMNLA